jgi:hypothetical protein
MRKPTKPRKRKPNAALSKISALLRDTEIQRAHTLATLQALDIVIQGIEARAAKAKANLVANTD